jgi:hypothetical protein
MGDDLSRQLNSVATAATPMSEGTFSSPDSLSSPSAYNVPGNFIDIDENAGLPGRKDAEGHARREAERVVHSHTRKRFFGFGRKNSRKKKHQKHAIYEQDRRDRSAAESAESTDVERDAGRNSMSGTAGGGVLSALLTLYDQDTAATSIGSTPGRSSLDSVPEKPWMHPKEDSPKRWLTEELRRPQPISRLSTEISPTSSVTDLPAIPSIKTGKASSVKSKIPAFSPSGMFSSGKLTNTRNAGGVFGPLIASTGNITGIAAPTSSQLQPDVKRPGYRLSRFVPNIPFEPNTETIRPIYDQVFGGRQICVGITTGIESLEPNPNPL